MKAQVGELKQSPIGLPSLSSLTYDRTPSPFKKSSHKLITNESMRNSALPHDFIDGHQTFYMGLFQKLKMDVDTKKSSSSVLRDGSPVKSSSKQLNMSAIEPYRSSEINFIDKNIQNLIDKRRTKRFRYLEDDDKIKLAIEPKKLIKGLDELNMKIERTFINRKRDDDYSTRMESRRNVDTTQKTYKSQHSTVSVAMKLDSMPNSYQKGGDSRQPMRVKKRSQTNFTRDHRDRDEKAETFQADAPKGLRLADKMKIADEKIEISFDKKFKKAQPQLPQVRSISQPRPASRTTEKETKSNNNSAYNTRSFEQSKIKSAQVKEFNDYEESVSGYMYPDKGPVFRKMLDYIKNNDTEILEFDENREYIHLKPSPEKEKEKLPKELRTPSRHESINKGSRKNTELRKTTIDEHGTLSNLNNNTGSIHNNGSINTLNNLSPGNKKLDLMKAFTEHNLPSRPLIKSLENNAFILENYPINAEMCDSIGALLKDKGDVTNISLVNNKLNDQALSVLLTPLLSKSAEVSIFRCVKNSFGDFFLGVFEKKFFALGNNTLKELTLDGCKILQKSLIEVIEVLLGARSRLKYLGLSDIGLNEHSMVTLNRFIESSEYLMSLDVSWNKMNNDAMKMLLDNVRISQSLRSLDLSWNSLGHQDSKLAKILKEMIVTSPLVHLNLSHTGLNDFDAILIIEGVKLNKNLMSLHLGGNYITVPVIKRLSSHLEAVKKLSDFLPPCIDKVKNRVYSKLHPGYQFSYKGSEVTSTTTSPTKKGHGRRDSMVHSSLDDIAEEDEFNQEINNALQLIYYRIIDPDVQENNNVWIESRNCWICERWRKTQVSYTVPKPAENPKNNNNNPGGKRPKNMRNQRLSRDITDEENSSKLQSGKEDVRISGTFSNNQSLKMTFNKQQRAFEFSDYLPPGLHHYKICWLKGQGSMVTTGTQETVDGGSEVLLEGNLSIKPRDTDVKPIRENEKEEKVEEKKKKQEFIKDRSVFAEFRLDDEISLRKAFELDVRRWKLKDATLKKAEADKILIFLYKKYTTVRSIFMRYAAWNCYPFISLEGFADCLDECKVYDNDFKRLDAMKVFNKEAAEDGADGPQTSVCRAEFMEGLLRVAIARVNPKRIADVQAEAVEKFLNENVFIYALDSRKTYEEFRKLKVHTYEVDALLKLNLDALESIFKKKRHLFGVRVESTKEILAVAGIQITDRDLLWMFSHSKMLIIDEEKDSKKYLVLSFVEFLEFLVRLADFLAEEGPIAQKLSIFLEKLLKAHKFNFVPSP